MHHDDDDPDATLERERMSVTKIYWKPEPPKAEPPKVVVDSGLVRAARAMTPPMPVPTVPQSALMPTVQAPALPPPGWVVAPPPTQYPPPMPAPVERTAGVHRMPRTLVRLAFGAICVLLGIAIGSVIVFGNRSGSKSTVAAASPPPPVAPAPAPPPAAKPAPAPIAQPARVAVRIDSEPTGALTTLVDDGKAISLGPTPVDTQLDPAKHYEVVLSLEDHKTNVQVIDPSKDQHMVVVLAADPKPAAEPARKHRAKKPKHVETDEEDEAPAPDAQGTLKVTSKPPCSIVVDGKQTGLVTPQAALPLSVGKHEITLTNVDQGIHLTTTVEISTDTPAVLIKDFTK